MSARLLDGKFSEGFETLRLLVADGEFTEELGAAIRAQGGVRRAITALRKEFLPVAPVTQPPPIPEPVIRVWELEVSNRPLAALIAVGQYNYVDPNITEDRFPHTSQGVGDEWEAVTVGFGRRMSDSAVDAEFRRLGIEMGNMAPLAAFGVKYPEVQRGNPVVALGQHWLSPSGGRYRGVLDGLGSERSLCLGWSAESFVWGEVYLFLGFRKKPAVSAGK